MSTKVNTSVSFPFLSILCLLFIGLKLGEVGVVATWSWWWVLSPLWIPITTVLAFLAFGGILYLIASKLEK